MSRAISASSGKPYGVARVCRIWHTARATFIATADRARQSRRGGADRQDRCRTQRW